MPGASDETRRIKVLNANWAAGDEGEDGRFELLVITDDDQHHVITPSPAATTAIAALLQAEPVLAWDPTNRTLVAANLVGEMPWTRDQPSPTRAP